MPGVIYSPSRTSRVKELHDFRTHVGATGGSQKELGKFNIVLLNELGAAQSISIKNPSADQHRSAFIPLSECLGLRQTTYAQRCGHDRIRLVGKSVEKSLHPVKFIWLIKPLISLTNCVIERDDNFERRDSQFE